MTHRFPIKELALQTGLSTATIDRVLNNRAHVSPQTRHRVRAAVLELERQEAQLSASGRRMFFDFVVEAPKRFSSEVKQAAERVLPQIKTAACRLRFVLQETMTDDEVVAALNRIAKRGSHGVCLKARDVPKIRAAIDRLTERGIPVVTLVTDIPTSTRLQYIGIDNKSAGRTAAYLLSRSLQNVTGTVLISKSQTEFFGEEERAAAFSVAIGESCPELKLVEASGGSGVPHGTAKAIDAVIGKLSELRAVYSMGGGNRAILTVLANNKLYPQIYVAHDNNPENLTLLREQKISFVLVHNLQEDIYAVFNALMSNLGTNARSSASPIGIMTPFSG